MKVTISELRSMIREALQEKVYQEDMGGAPPGEMEEGTYRENTNPVHEDAALEEAWEELEEAAGVVEEKKEKPLTETIRALVRKTLLEAKKAEKDKKDEAKAKKPEPAKKAEEEEEPKAERGEKGMKITKAQLMKALDLNPNQEIDFKNAIKRGDSVAKALAAATRKKSA